MALDQSVVADINIREAFRDVIRSSGAPSKWMNSEDEAEAILDQQRAKQEATELLQTMGAGAEVAEQIGKAGQARGGKSTRTLGYMCLGAHIQSRFFGSNIRNPHGFILNLHGLRGKNSESARLGVCHRTFREGSWKVPGRFLDPGAALWKLCLLERRTVIKWCA
jgi:hypothetical protein